MLPSEVSKLRVAVGTGEDDLLGLDRVADVQGPWLGVAQDRNLPRSCDDFGGGVLRYGEQLGQAGRRGGYNKQRANHPVGTTQPHKVNENPGRFHTKVLCGLQLTLVLLKQSTIKTCIARRHPIGFFVTKLYRFSLFQGTGNGRKDTIDSFDVSEGHSTGRYDCRLALGLAALPWCVWARPVPGKAESVGGTWETRPWSLALPSLATGAVDRVWYSRRRLQLVCQDRFRPCF